MTILRDVRALIGAWCDEHNPAGYPLDREQTITLVSQAIAELTPSEPAKPDPTTYATDIPAWAKLEKGIR